MKLPVAAKLLKRSTDRPISPIGVWFLNRSKQADIAGDQNIRELLIGYASSRCVERGPIVIQRHSFALTTAADGFVAGVE